MCNIFVVSVNVDSCAKEHRTEFFERFNNGQWLFFDGGAILLGFVEFMGAECTWKSVLFDNCSQLKVRGVGFCVKGESWAGQTSDVLT